MAGSDWFEADRWEAAQSALLAFLDSVGADEEAFTAVVRLIPIETSSAAAFQARAERWSERDGEWSIVTTSADDSGRKWGYALPVTAQTAPEPYLIPFVEIHSLLAAWFLTYSWRTRQLTRSGLAHLHAGDILAAAACVRPLVETAAACFVDGGKLQSAWNAVKQAGPPTLDGDAFARKSEMLSILNELTWGAKFDDKASERQKSWTRVKRTNVLTQVEKLAKAAGSQLQYDYQWLCNTVHPSIGNTFAFSGPSFVHDTRTHIITHFAGRPIHVTGPQGDIAEDTIQQAIVSAGASSCQCLAITLDAALRMIDDVALTTAAPRLSREPYWRQIVATKRNDMCLCRSGRKQKLCRHVWGEPSPEFPRALDINGGGGALRNDEH